MSLANQLTLNGAAKQPAVNPPFRAYRHVFGRTAVFPLNAAESVAMSTTRTTIFQLPPGAIVTAGALVVGTLFDSTGSATIAVGSDSSGTAYLAQTTIKSAGTTALSTLPSYSPSAASLITVTQVAPAGATVGELFVYVTYFLANGEDFSVGDDLQTNI